MKMAIFQPALLVYQRVPILGGMKFFDAKMYAAFRGIL